MLKDLKSTQVNYVRQAWALELLGLSSQALDVIRAGIQARDRQLIDSLRTSHHWLSLRNTREFEQILMRLSEQEVHNSRFPDEQISL